MIKIWEFVRARKFRIIGIFWKNWPHIFIELIRIDDWVVGSRVFIEYVGTCANEGATVCGAEPISCVLSLGPTSWELFVSDTIATFSSRLKIDWFAAPSDFDIEEFFVVSYTFNPEEPMALREICTFGSD